MIALSMPGLPKVAASGKKIPDPKEPVRIQARGDKLVNYEVVHVQDGGVLGILKQMGAAVPQQ